MDKVLPTHVGIIMDGNGRWAKKRGLPRLAGHKKGADVFGKIARYANKTGIKYLTVYAFSTENWKRPPEEVAGIMDLLRVFLKDTDKYIKEDIRILVIGDKTALDSDIRGNIDELERKSRGNKGLALNIALNYGGRDEIIRAVKALAADVKSGVITDLGGIGEEAFGRYLDTGGIPDVDLVIRTSGEQRISNFLLWQSAYAEYFFTPTLWPDFTEKDFDAAVKDFSSRNRRQGNI